MILLCVIAAMGLPVISLVPPSYFVDGCFLSRKCSLAISLLPDVPTTDAEVAMSSTLVSNIQTPTWGQLMGSFTDCPLSGGYYRCALGVLPDTSATDLIVTFVPLLTALNGNLTLIFNATGFDSANSTFIVDPEGVIRSVAAYDLSVGRNVGEVLRTLDALQTDELCPCNWEKGQDTLHP